MQSATLSEAISFSRQGESFGSTRIWSRLTPGISTKRFAPVSGQRRLTITKGRSWTGSTLLATAISSPGSMQTEHDCDRSIKPLLSFLQTLRPRGATIRRAWFGGAGLPARIRYHRTRRRNSCVLSPPRETAPVL